MKRYPLTNQHIAVIGMGMTGLACARYLHDNGALVSMFDTREAPEGLAQAQEIAQCFTGDINTGEHFENILKHELVVVSPGIDLAQPIFETINKDAIPLLSEIELFADAVDKNKPVYAVTGSNGKSTVVALLEKMLLAAGKQVAMGGNYGIPALELLEKNADCYVIELSSFQLETTHNLHCNVACILNISEDHIDRHRSMSSYIEKKQKIYQHAKQCVANLEDKATWPVRKAALMFAQSKSNNVSAVNGISTVSYLSDDGQGGFNIVVDGEVLVNSRDMALKGKHNLQNIMACLLILRGAIEINDAVKQAMCEFTGLDYRCKFVSEIAGVDWINDSKGTNVGATAAAVSGLAKDNNIILIAGGVGKGADFTPLANVSGVKAIVLFGRDADVLNKAINQANLTSIVDVLDEAVKLAKTKAQSGDIVLFSPACASYDQYKNYIERGKHFNALVKDLEKLEEAS